MRRVLSFWGIIALLPTGCALVEHLPTKPADGGTTALARTSLPSSDRAWVFVIKKGGPTMAGAEVETPAHIRTFLSLDMFARLDLPPGPTSLSIYRNDGYHHMVEVSAPTPMRDLVPHFVGRNYRLTRGQYAEEFSYFRFENPNAQAEYIPAAEFLRIIGTDSAKWKVVDTLVRRGCFPNLIIGGDAVDKPTSTLSTNLVGGRVYFAEINMMRGGQLPVARWISPEVGTRLVSKFPMSDALFAFDVSTGIPKVTRAVAGNPE